MANSKPKKAESKFNPADGKMTVIDGMSAYVAGEYTVLHKQLPMNINPQNYSGYLRLMQITVQKDKKKILEYVLGQEFKMQGIGQASTNYFLEVLEFGGDSYPIQRYDAYPDLNVLMVRAIEYAMYYEENVLCGMEPSKFESLKSEISSYLKKLHPESRFIHFKRCFGNFVFIQFQPSSTYYHHSVGVAFDHVNSRYYYLTSTKSYEKFLTSNRIELVGKGSLITEKTKDLLVDLIKITASMSYNTVYVESNEALVGSPYCTEQIRALVSSRLSKLESPVSKPQLVDKSIIFFTADYRYPSNVTKWVISEKDGKVSLSSKLLLDKLYLPEFVEKDSLSPEDGGNYIR